MKTKSERERTKTKSGRKRVLGSMSRINFVIVTQDGGCVEYKTHPHSTFDEKHVKGVAALMLIALGVELPVTITEKDVEGA